MLVASGGSAAPSAMINDGAGAYQHTDDFYVGLNPAHVEVIDVDGDGAPEVLSARMSGVVTLFPLAEIREAIAQPRPR
jgi:hypothetical protein